MELNIKTKEQIFYSVNDGICINKYWIEKDNMVEFLLDYRKKFDKSKKKQASEILKTAIQQGMTTMIEDGINKVSSGLTTIEEVLHAVREK